MSISGGHGRLGNMDDIEGIAFCATNLKDREVLHKDSWPIDRNTLPASLLGFRVQDFGANGSSKS
jgi:hypothetical protein